MSNQDNFAIGESSFERGFTKTKWFTLEIGENLFRILPPLWSLAPLKKWSQYHATHGGFKNSRGKFIKFQCIEESHKGEDSKKIIDKHCPVCDYVNEKKAQYDDMKKSGKFTDDQMSAFNEKFIRWYQVERKNYVNAIDANGEIGVLPLPYKCFMSLEELCKKQKAKGDDITGMEGAYVRFNKQSRYKGDSQVNYFADLAMEQDGDVMKIKRHRLTDDIIAQLKAKSRDLSGLYKTFTSEQITALLNASEEERPVLMDKYVGKNDDGGGEEQSREEEVLRPSTAAATVAASPAPAYVAPAAQASATPPPPAAAPAAAAPAPAQVFSQQIEKSAPAATAAPVGTMTDEQFNAMFLKTIKK